MTSSRLAALAMGALAISVNATLSLPIYEVGASTTPGHAGIAAAVASSGAWTVYHHDNARTGYDSTQPNVTGATTGWVSPTLDGQVYGEPLAYSGLVYVATLKNTVYAINQSTGVVVWSRNLGTPQTTGWQCGNVNPTGILGTGVIDTGSSRIYVVPFLHSALSYYLVGLDLATGTVGLSTPVKPAGFDWTIQQERGALAISKDGTHVYVPFGGRAGDCGAYNGWVAGVPTNGTTTLEIYKTPSHASGVWAAGGVVVDDATGNVFFATGNAIPCSGAINSDSVIRTSATLGSATFFQPNDWSAHWCVPDSDLGSATPVLISPNLMFTSGKYGQGFLLDPSALGGRNGQLFPARSPYAGADVCGGIHSDATFGAFAYASPYVYLECDGGGLVALMVNTGTPSFSLCDATCGAPSWSAGGSATFGPPIVAGGAVWVADIGGGGLYGYDAATGAQIFHSAAFGVNHFTAPSEAGGQIFVSGDTVVRSFNLVFGCKSVAEAASPASAAMVGTAVTVTASANGCPNPSPLYQFWMKAPGASLYTLAQGYSANAVFNWVTTGMPTGTYRINVWVRDAASAGAFGNSSGRWDAYNANLTYTLTAGCPAVGETASPAGAAMPGTQVAITGAAPGCPSARYQFWVLAPGAGLYTLAQPYGSANVFTWDTTGLPTGTYRINVWVRDNSSAGTFANSSGTWDAYNASLLYTLTSGCPAVSDSAAPPSTAAAGTTVVVTAAAPGCPNPRYQFWVLAPGAGLYTLAQPYSSGAVFSWVTTGLAPGTYRINVWVRDISSSGVFGNSSGRWDAYNAGLLYTLT